MVNESASDDHSLTLWTQKMEFCALRLWRSVYFFLSVSPLWGGGEERDSGEKMRWCVCFLSMQIWKVNWTTREGIGSITLKISIGSTDHLSGRNCLVLSIHLYNIWHHSFATSLYICFLTSVQSCRHHSSSPKQEDPFISPCCFVISADSCCFFLFFFFFWCDFHVHNTSRDVWLSLQYIQKGPLPHPTLSTVHIHECLHLFSLAPSFPCSSCTVYATWCKVCLALPQTQEQFSHLTPSPSVSAIFSAPSHWAGKKSSTHTLVLPLALLDAPQPLIFNQKEVGLRKEDMIFLSRWFHFLGLIKRTAHGCSGY